MSAGTCSLALCLQSIYYRASARLLIPVNSYYDVHFNVMEPLLRHFFDILYVFPFFLKKYFRDQIKNHLI